MLGFIINNVNDKPTVSQKMFLNAPNFLNMTLRIFPNYCAELAILLHEKWGLNPNCEFENPKGDVKCPIQR